MDKGSAFHGGHIYIANVYFPTITMYIYNICLKSKDKKDKKKQIL